MRGYRPSRFGLESTVADAVTAAVRGTATRHRGDSVTRTTDPTRIGSCLLPAAGPHRAVPVGPDHCCH